MAGFVLHKSLTARAAVVGFVATFAAVSVAAIAFRQTDRLDRYEQSYSNTQNVLLSAIDPRFQTKVEEVARVAERMVVIGAIKGGTLFDASGHRLQSFGEQTETGFQTVLDTGRTIFRPKDADRLEFYYSPDVSRTPFHVIVRFATGGVEAELAARENRMIVLALGGGLAAGLPVALFFLLFVALPIRRINRIIGVALADPANADSGKSLSSDGSEVGQMALAIECMRSTLAGIWRSKVLVANSILESSPFAILQMNAEGVPVFNNPACVGLFERDVVHSFSSAPLPILVRDVESGEQLKLKAFIDQLDGCCRLIEIPTAVNRRYALVSSQEVGQHGRPPLTVVLAADVSTLQQGRLKAERLAGESGEALRLAGFREFELKMMLESCLALIGGANGSDVHLDATPFAREWLDTGRESGLVSSYQCGEEGPQVVGDRENLRAAVRLALIAASAQCRGAPVEIAVDFRGISFEAAGMEVTARTTGGAASRPSVADPALVLAALRKAVRRVGGQLAEMSAEEGRCVLRLTLRGVAERVSTAMKTAAKS